ncbi:MAG: hypothetical protein AAF702_19540 [Chloroflexota bacterium]
MAADRRQQMRKRIHELYAREHAALGNEGTLQLLEKAEQWDLSSTLPAGGVIVFPHAGVAECGHQIATAVQACLNSGAERVLVLSVLHAFTEEMEEARIRVANGGDVTQEKFWGIQGTGIDGERQEWRHDHALISWRHFWAAETKRRGINGPEVIERYPYLAGGKPEQLPGVEEVAQLAQDAVIVSTADPFHHGIGYGTPPEESYMPDQGGLELARESINEGIKLLEDGDYWGYNQHCVDAKSDARDAGQLFRYLRGPLRGEIVDLTYSDATELYNQPPPTWVATALYDWRVA